MQALPARENLPRQTGLQVFPLLKLKAVSDDLMETRQIIARVIAEHSGKTIEEVLAKTASASFFRAEEAVSFGLADRIITSLGQDK